MKRLSLLIAAMVPVLLSATLQGEDKITFTTLDGKLYENVKVTRSTGDGIVVMHSSGMATIQFENLSAEIQTKYGYDPQKAQMAREEYQKGQQEQLRKAQMQNAEKARTETLANEPKITLMVKVWEVEVEVEDGYLICKRIRWIAGSDPPHEEQNFVVTGHPRISELAEDEFFTATMVRGNRWTTSGVNFVHSESRNSDQNTMSDPFTAGDTPLKITTRIHDEQIRRK